MPLLSEPRLFLRASGFTLVELLVVIAIIGVITAVIFASFSNARNSGSDAAIKSEVETIRKQVELYSTQNQLLYDTASTVGTAPAVATCGTTGMWSDFTIQEAVKAVVANAGSATVNNVANQSVFCKSTSSTWTIAVVLKSDTTKAWCADHLGRSRRIATPGSLAAGLSFGGVSGCPAAN
jgi:prepilin-type N-terminal cleavage/methylation domain-containing protein